MSSVLLAATDASAKTFSATTSGVETSCKTVRMFVDANRDGTLTDANTDEWSWGSSGHGALLVPNETNDAALRLLSPIGLRPKGTTAEETTLQGTLALAAGDALRVRVYQDGNLVLGGSTASFTLDIPTGGVTLGIEATRFRRSPDEPPISLSFTPTVGGKAGPAQVAAFLEAPWILPPRVNAADKVYCASIDATFAQDLGTLSGLTVDTTLFTKDEQRFVQDSMKLGATCNATTVRRVVLRTPAAKWDVPFAGSTFDNMPVITVADPTKKNNAADGGNIQVSPPTDGFPLGRIYYSVEGGPHKIDPKLEAFLHAQVVQAPFAINAKWLAVGHVDEMISFLPVQKGLLACVPSPGVAFQILLAAVDADAEAVMLEDRLVGNAKMASTTSARSVLMAEQRPNLGWMSTSDLARDLAKKAPGAGSAAAFLKAAQDRVVEELPAVTFLELPVLFTTGKDGAEALTANIVNMVVDGTTCVFPKPYGPVAGADVTLGKIVVKKGEDLFEQYTIQMLNSLGFQAKAIDTWDTYHRNHGETHCATSVRRQFAGYPWWTIAPARPSKGKGKKEEETGSNKIVVMPANNDCFFHAVLWHLDRANYLDLGAVSELRCRIAAFLTRIFPGVEDLFEDVGAKIPELGYLAATESMLQALDTGREEVQRYKDAKADDDFLGQNIVDAIFRMRFNHQEIDEGKIPGMPKGTIWGDNKFIAEAVSESEECQILIYTGGDLSKETETVGDELFAEKKIRLVLSEDANHWDVYDPDG